ncbi:MAG: hypothetical protein ACREP1_07855, partial [Rhodanobacteraceae bacterium]
IRSPGELHAPALALGQRKDEAGGDLFIRRKSRGKLCARWSPVQAMVDERGDRAVEFPMAAPALRALLEHAIDYAGLFPPASLALEPALQKQAASLRSPDRWMLGAFILPVGKFAATASQLSQFSTEHPLQISALGPKDVAAAGFGETLQGIVAAIDKFSAEDKGVIAITQFEMPLPLNVDQDSLGEVEDSLGKRGLKIFWEAPAEDAPAVIEALAGREVGFKLRTGGVSADAFPTDAQIARALVASARHQVPIKFTAGLHHPVKKFHDSVGTKMHGFLNVLGAGVLAAEHDWDEAQTAAMLADEDAQSFGFDLETFRWRDWQISTKQIAARRRLVTSLGSCSFDEPREDLRALDLF